MTTRWYIAKYVPDPARNEPRNVGVVAASDQGVAFRFFALDESNPEKLDGRRARRLVKSSRSYRLWLQTWRNMLAHGTRPEMMKRRPLDPFYLVPGGETVIGPEISLQKLVDDLYNRLVFVAELEDRVPLTQRVEQAISSVESRRDVHFERNYSLDRGVIFEYYLPKREALIKRLTLSEDKDAWRRVNDARLCFERSSSLIEGRRLAIVSATDVDGEVSAQIEALRDSGATVINAARQSAFVLAPRLEEAVFKDAA